MSSKRSLRCRKATFINAEARIPSRRTERVGVDLGAMSPLSNDPAAPPALVVGVEAQSRRGIKDGRRGSTVATSQDLAPSIKLLPLERKSGGELVRTGL